MVTRLRRETHRVLPQPHFKLTAAPGGMKTEAYITWGNPTLKRRGVLPEASTWVSSRGRFCIQDCMPRSLQVFSVRPACLLS